VKISQKEERKGKRKEKREERFGLLFEVFF
jgi:hypothetical protein